MLFQANRDTVELQGRHGPASNTAAVVTVSASTTEYWVVDSIHYSYDGAPTGGLLTISYADPGSAAQIFWRVTITATGPGEFLFPKGFYEGVVNRDMAVTLAAGGAGVSGKVNITYR